MLSLIAESQVATEMSLWNDLVRQSPSAAAVVITVLIFVKFLRDMGERQDKADERREETLSKLGDSCHSFQHEIHTQAASILAKSSDVIERNTEALGRAHAVLERTERATSK